jgi:DinB superfamily
VSYGGTLYQISPDVCICCGPQNRRPVGDPAYVRVASMIGRPEPDEAAPYYFTYINQVPGDEPVAVIERQLKESLTLFATISEEKSLHRYAPGKWSIRQLLNHLTDTERAFAFRALWFARGFDSPLPDYDQNIAAAGAEADRVPWAAHVEEFGPVRLSTISLFANMPVAAWQRTGVASGNRFTVRALAFITAGHVEHHLKILRERYL